MKVFEVIRYFDDYMDGIVKTFEDEDEAKKLASKLNSENKRPYISYVVKPKTV